MKKVCMFLGMTTLIMLSVCSCSKDKDEDLNLVGSKWDTTSISYIDGSDGYEKGDKVLTFTSSTTAQMKNNYSGISDGSPYSGTAMTYLKYIISGKIITFTETTSETGFGTVQATVSGNSMTFSSTGEVWKRE